MSRLVALTVVMSLGASPLTYAGEGLMQSASRIVHQQVADGTGHNSTVSRAVTVADRGKPPSLLGSPAVGAQNAQQQVLSKAGMRTRTKVMIYLAAGVGLAAAAWQIDHSVLDVTPSSLGTRRDGCKPFCGGE
jgi:hypothetical protein